MLITKLFTITYFDGESKTVKLADMNSAGTYAEVFADGRSYSIVEA